MTTQEFFADALDRAARRNRNWYSKNLLHVLEAAKEKQAREVDASISLAKDLLQLLNSPKKKPETVLPHDLIPSETNDLMKPVEPEILDMLYKSTEKGSTFKYLKARYMKSPEDKFNYRVTTNLDYGWHQKQTRVPPRDVNKGRCAILRDTFYRKNNLAPDPEHYSQPAGGEFSICSVYSCNFN